MDCARKCKQPKKSVSFKLTSTLHEGAFREDVGCPKGQFDFWLKEANMKMISVTEVQKMTLVDAFGLVGGYLGLFVGVSVITTIEFVEFGLSYFARCFKKQSGVDSHAQV